MDTQRTKQKAKKAAKKEESSSDEAECETHGISLVPCDHPSHEDDEDLFCVECNDGRHVDEGIQPDSSEGSFVLHVSVLLLLRLTLFVGHIQSWYCEACVEAHPWARNSGHGDSDGGSDGDSDDDNQY